MCFFIIIVCIFYIASQDHLVCYFYSQWFLRAHTETKNIHVFFLPSMRVSIVDRILILSIVTSLYIIYSYVTREQTATTVFCDWLFQFFVAVIYKTVYCKFKEDYLLKSTVKKFVSKLYFREITVVGWKILFNVWVVFWYIRTLVYGYWVNYKCLDIVDDFCQSY